MTPTCDPLPNYMQMFHNELPRAPKPCQLLRPLRGPVHRCVRARDARGGTCGPWAPGGGAPEPQSTGPWRGHAARVSMGPVARAAGPGLRGGAVSRVPASRGAGGRTDRCIEQCWAWPCTVTLTVPSWDTEHSVCHPRGEAWSPSKGISPLPTQAAVPGDSRPARPGGEALEVSLSEKDTVA